MSDEPTDEEFAEWQAEVKARGDFFDERVREWKRRHPQGTYQEYYQFFRRFTDCLYREEYWRSL
jgi:hypothetical protein